VNIHLLGALALMPPPLRRGILLNSFDKTVYNNKKLWPHISANAARS